MNNKISNSESSGTISFLNLVKQGSTVELGTSYNKKRGLYSHSGVSYKDKLFGVRLNVNLPYDGQSINITNEITHRYQKIYSGVKINYLPSEPSHSSLKLVTGYYKKNSCIRAFLDHYFESSSTELGVSYYNKYDDNLSWVLDLRRSNRETNLTLGSKQQMYDNTTVKGKLSYVKEEHNCKVSVSMKHILSQHLTAILAVTLNTKSIISPSSDDSTLQSFGFEIQSTN